MDKKELENAKYMFRKNVRYLRLSNNMTLEQFGKIIGVVKSAVANYESGLREMDSIQLLKICQYFGVDADDMFNKDIGSYDKEYIEMKSIRNKILNQTNEMNLEQLKKIQQMIEIIR